MATPMPGLFTRPLDPAAFPSFELEVRPEFLRALDAAIPDVACSRSVRFKMVPVTGLALDGSTVPGRHTLRYRGFCSSHWKFAQKSLKVQAERGRLIGGYRAINLDALDSDPYLYEVWANRLLQRTGGLTSRVGLVRLTINGRYDGLRELVENLDGDLIEGQGFPKGALYREREFAELGNPDQLGERIEEFWQKNSLKNAGWQDLELLNQAIHRAVASGDAGYLRHVNVPQYVNYSAVVAITGTTQQDFHNIPIYSPRGRAEFIPVGYDFGSNSLDLGAEFDAVQIPYASLNRLSQLVWADAALRRRVHRRIAAILARFPGLLEDYDEILRAAEPELARGLASGTLLSSLKGRVTDLESYRRSNRVRSGLRRRLGFLRRAYLDPLARMTPGGLAKESFQLAIEGAGVYRVSFEPAAGPCREGAAVRVRGHDGAWREAARCRGGRVETPTFDAERNDVPRPTLASRGTARNTVGAVLLDVENRGGIRLAGARIVSLQTGKVVPLGEDWPFELGALAQRGRYRIGAPPRLAYRRSPGDGDGFSFPRVPRQANFSYEADSGALELQGGVAGPERTWDYGPILCWSIRGRGFCHELAARDFPGMAIEPRRLAAEPAPGARTLKPGSLLSCRSFTFTPGPWLVALPAGNRPDCAVAFAPGARLRFAEGAFLVLRGSVTFPDAGPPVSFGPDGRAWGGLVLQPGSARCEVRNAEFSRSGEFYYRKRRYTGSLTVEGAGSCLIHDNVFHDNYGDDGLNVYRGRATIARNLFYGNRDAIDIDAAGAVVEDNAILGTSDDGLDLGEGSGPVVVRRNLIRGAGDKGISIGEGSRALVQDTLIEASNVGVAVKEASAATLRGALLRNNRIAVSVYRKAAAAAERGLVEGDAAWEGNEIGYQADGHELPAPDGLVVRPPAGGLRRRMARRLLNSCPACRKRAREAAGE